MHNIRHAVFAFAFRNQCSLLQHFSSAGSWAVFRIYCAHSEKLCAILLSFMITAGSRDTGRLRATPQLGGRPQFCGPELGRGLVGLGGAAVWWACVRPQCSLPKWVHSVVGLSGAAVWWASVGPQFDRPEWGRSSLELLHSQSRAAVWWG